jgi:hypothetical protein
MKLYHFTTIQYVPSIFESGLWKGDRLWKRNSDWSTPCVWLTTDVDSSGHGLDGSGADKRRIRFEFLIASTHPRLKHWPRYAKGKISDEEFEAYNCAGGGKSFTWYIYLGVLRPTECLDLMTDTVIRSEAQALEMLDYEGLPAQYDRPPERRVNALHV